MTEDHKTLVSLDTSDQQCPSPVPGPCLSDDDILVFVQGRTQGDGLDRVHTHLDVCDVCQRLVTEAAHALDDEPMSESGRPSWNAVFQPHAMIAKRYRIVRLVARGGMGEVYEAHDTALHERVAIKTVTSTSSDSAQAVRYLKAEVQLARRVSHPNVCRIYDLGTHVMERSAGEIYFLVMEFVEGECLGHRLRQFGALPTALAHSIAHQLLLGLRAAHQAGILHRDFKSDNVMLRRESNGSVTPVILDFGLAKALNENGDLASTRSHSQGMVGTISYMAPEQVEGEPLSTATDIYAFGVVWFEMLTGRLPFVRETPAASMMARLSERPAPPSSVNPRVPAAVDDLVLQCLSRRRADRFATADQVLEALANQLGGPPSAPPPRSHARRRGAFITLTVIAVLAVGGGMLWQEYRPPRQESPPGKLLGLASPKTRVIPAPSKSSPLVPTAPVTRPSDSAPPAASTVPVSPSRTRPAAQRPSRGATPQTAAVPNASASAIGTAMSLENRQPPPTPKEPDWLPIWSKDKGTEPPPVSD